MTIANLAEHCNKYSSCDGCELSADSKKCMLRHLTLPEVIMKLSIPKKNQVVWVRFENKVKLLEALDNVREILTSNAGCNPVQLYAEEENVVKELGSYNLINDTGIEILNQKYGKNNVKVEEIIKGA